MVHAWEASIRAVGEAHRKYTWRVNRRQKVRGYLFQGRFFSCPLDDRHTLAAVRYVERNPVRAGLVVRAEEYPWSSAAGHCGLCPDVLAADREILNEQVGDWQAFLRDEENRDEADQLRLHTRTGRPLGGMMFLNLLETLLNRSVRPRKAGRPRKERAGK